MRCKIDLFHIVTVTLFQPHFSFHFALESTRSAFFCVRDRRGLMPATFLNLPLFPTTMLALIELKTLVNNEVALIGFAQEGSLVNEKRFSLIG